MRHVGHLPRIIIFLLINTISVKYISSHLQVVYHEINLRHSAYTVLSRIWAQYGFQHSRTGNVTLMRNTKVCGGSGGKDPLVLTSVLIGYE